MCVGGRSHSDGSLRAPTPLQLPRSLWGLPCPLCPLHLPLLNSTPQSPGFPPASLQNKVLWPSCLIAVIYGAFPPPRGGCPPSTAHSSLWWHTMRGILGLSHPRRPFLGADTPHCGGFQVPHFGGLRLPQRSPLAASPPLCSGWGAGRTAAVPGAGPRAVHQNGGAPDWPAPAPRRARAYEEAEAAVAADCVQWG